MKSRTWTWMTASYLLAALSLTIVFALTPSAEAQTYRVIYNFTGGQGGRQPEAGLTIDHAGRLYGTTLLGGNTGGSCGANGCGTVFRLEPQGSGWVFTPLYNFQGGTDGSSPYARVIFGPDGGLYGTTAGGGTNGLGTVFNLRPPATFCRSVSCPWTETVIHSFGGADGTQPQAEVVFDQAGNMYGTTVFGGALGQGSVYELTRSGGGWMERVLYSFMGGSSDGANPVSGVIFDQSGNLWGTTFLGGRGAGTAYQLTPSGGGWQESFLHKFEYSVDGALPQGGLVLDSGDLYGTTERGELLRGYFGGTLFQIRHSTGGWTLSTQCVFLGTDYNRDLGSEASLAIGPDGTLYGTTINYSNGLGSVFGSRSRCSSVHDFTGGAGGAHPVSNIVFGSNGHLYGTTLDGGADSWGVVWEITL